MELSSQEIGVIVKELNSLLGGYYVSSVGSVGEGTLVFRLHHSTLGERQLVFSARRGLWLSKFEMKLGGTSSLLGSMRHELDRCRFVSVRQHDDERVVFVDFEGPRGRRSVIGEFFGVGNVVLVDDAGVILALKSSLSVRHRTLRRGLKYVLPPSRGKSLFSVSTEDLRPLLSARMRVLQWIGRTLSTSRKYVEEISDRSGIGEELSGVELGEEDVSRLFGHVQGLASQFRSGEDHPLVWYSDGKPVEASPFDLKTLSRFEPKAVSSFTEAVDEVFTAEILSSKFEKEVEPVRKQVAELEQAIGEQKKSRSQLESAESEIRRVASSLMSCPGDEDTSEYLGKLGLEVMQKRRGILAMKVSSVDFEFPDSVSSKALASLLFDKAKEINVKVSAIVSAEAVLQSKLQGVSEGIDSSQISRPLQERREKSWFERFRWFHTSEGFLAVGGRDASSNSSLIRKYLSQEDLVFHADLHGSPFFLLKGDGKFGEASVQEVAQAVVSYSSAWRAGLMVGDAFCVKPDQVKKQAPSGMYLPKGSFLIEGEKNYSKNVELKVAVGAAKRGEQLILIGGPPRSIEAHSLALVSLQPQKSKVTDTAKAVKAKLVGLLDPPNSEVLKHISLDEFIRVLPSSGGKIVFSRGSKKE